MSRRRLLLAFALAFALAFLVVDGNADSEDSGSDYTDNEIDLVPTFRTGIEKVLQGIASVVSSSSSSSSNSSESSGGIGKFLNSLIPKPIKKIVTPIENATAKGFGDILNNFEEHFHAIFPGTLWCGGGNIASSEEDVGLFERTDACCRTHDNCPSNIEAGRSNGILLNNGIFTRSACFCDQEFYECLKNVKSVVSTNIGTTYFNILRPQCFSYDYPIESCTELGKNRIVNRKCVQYKLDYTQNKTLEWFDNPDF